MACSDEMKLQEAAEEKRDNRRMKTAERILCVEICSRHHNCPEECARRTAAYLLDSSGCGCRAPPLQAPGHCRVATATKD